MNNANHVPSLFAECFTLMGVDSGDYSASSIKYQMYSSLHHWILSSGSDPKTLLAALNACFLVILL